MRQCSHTPLFLLILTTLFVSACSTSKLGNCPFDNYCEVIQSITSGVIKPSPDGIVLLPPNLRRASIDGYVYVSVEQSHATRILFKTWTGKGRNVAGMLYTSIPFTEQDMGLNYYGERTFPLGPVPLTVEAMINTNWYYVSYRLD